MTSPVLEIAVDAAVEADVALLGWGAYAPLDGFMGADDYRSVLNEMRRADGTLFPLPVVLPVDERTAEAVTPGDTVAITGPHGLVAHLVVRERFRREPRREAWAVYQTDQTAHPGVRALFAQPTWCLAGPVALLTEPVFGYPEPVRPQDVRAAIQARGWRTVAAFQTRNPIHRGHEYLHKVALETCDGLLLHPLTGPSQAEDVPAPVRLATYRVAVAHYYPPDRVLLAAYPAAMRFAGPREALFHALVRRNYGATHFIVGRDAAGVGGYYPPDEARRLVERYADELGLTALAFADAAYCPRCETVATERSCPHPEARGSLSGTAVRRLLKEGVRPPTTVMRPEVADVLIRAFGEGLPDPGP
ncbi:MAG: sulfate adenylyltransferase [Actinomycetia bacterium]|nr:sulfate adenylyltransferase [Actinomycetes bacterium]